MDELEILRKLVGSEADGWTVSQLEQLKRDIETMAALLLDLYRSRESNRRTEHCGLADFDVPPPER
jgi:hypothetical protein